MRILAVDAATPVAGVALILDGKIIAERFLDYKKNHSETLLPMIEAVLRETDTPLASIEALAVTIGPGSFTGLRIGLATVKGLSLAGDIPIVPVSTLATLAHNFPTVPGLVIPVLNARKQEVYAGFFRIKHGFPEPIAPEQALSPEALIETVTKLKMEHGFTELFLPGDGFSPYQEKWTEAFGEELLPVPPVLSRPRAGALASLAEREALQGKFADVYTLRPNYLRLSEAEYNLRKEK